MTTTAAYKIIVLLWMGHTVVFENCPVSIQSTFDIEKPAVGLLVTIASPTFQSDIDEQEMRKFLDGRDLNHFSWQVVGVADNEIIVAEPVVPSLPL